ncbi:energy transducer TonB [Aestuariibacter salexigens]|uniref:energy transducer TonB n=1 Tax=Aestuariibacter salexigens TaxID=226010 RepID=UPI0003FAF9B5|nr:TonB family protein [Aestuariibacter salexigens]
MSQVSVDELNQVTDRFYGVRFVLLFVIGAVVAGGLTLFMYVLIESSHKELDQSSRANLLDFVRVEREESSARKQRKPTRPETQDAPPAPPTPQASEQNMSDATLNVSAPTVDTSISVDVGAIGVGQGDGEYLPIVKVAPTYPIKASMAGTEGNCLVEYTVTETGATKDVTTVPGECPQVFVRASVEAARKFKYKPRVIDGEAIEVPNVRNLFKFTLQKREDSND